ncbi:peptide deformylase [Metamycoplasma neophronis]|uniref:Peptide deformylase n=1 Tax=Metamycoplasma neophronis TaxID=872983 RepID=A0ABY2Z1B7_9BACT|nr:peptide deformylase [Metamycoplasma neophronis]TPR54342.1 peptide deformylase [Metamycoplasma neophronis]
MFKFEDVKLVQLPEKVLREKSHDVPIPLTQEDDELIQKMIYHVDDSQEPLTKFRPAVGVAAVQYGILKNIFYIMIQDEKGEYIFKDALINPVMLGHSDHKISLSEGEGCLSVNENDPGQEGYVFRYSRVVVKAYSYYEKKWKTYDVSGYPAIVMQHEYDHLQGKLFIDHIDKKNPWEMKKNSSTI